MKSVFAIFQDGNPMKERAARAIMADRGGRFVGAGTFLPRNERDVQYDLEDEAAKGAAEALKRAGFTVRVIDVVREPRNAPHDNGLRFDNAAPIPVNLPDLES